MWMVREPNANNLMRILNNSCEHLCVCAKADSELITASADASVMLVVSSTLKIRLTILMTLHVTPVWTRLCVCLHYVCQK